MLFSGMRSLPRRFRLILCSLQQSDSLPFFDALTEEQIQAAFEDEGVSYADEDQVFTPAITLWGFLSQALHKEEQRSCLAAVARIGVLLIVMGRPRCAENNGPYCRARGRLPLPVIERLTGDGSQGDLDVPVGLQHDSPEDSAIRTATGCLAPRREFH